MGDATATSKTKAPITELGAIKCVRVHKYCQLARALAIDEQNQTDRGLIATATATEASTGNKLRNNHQWGLSYIYDRPGQVGPGQFGKAERLLSAAGLIDQTVTIWHLRVQSKQGWIVWIRRIRWIGWLPPQSVPIGHSIIIL